MNSLPEDVGMLRDESARVSVPADPSSIAIKSLSGVDRP